MVSATRTTPPSSSAGPDWLGPRPAAAPPLTAADLDTLERTCRLAPTEDGEAVASILNALGMDGDSLKAGLLLPAAEAGEVDRERLDKTVSATVADLLEGAARIGRLKDYHDAAEGTAQSERLRSMLLTMVGDPRVVIVRLADQLHRLRTAKTLPEAQRRALGRETLEVFAPLANRLGIWQLKWELEDLALRYLEPETYRRIGAWLKQRRAEREQYINAVTERLGTELRRSGIKARISGRPKHIYSIWNKMRRKQLDFDRIFDVTAVRVLVETVADCYAALGVVHTLWAQIPAEFDDYIARPKPNRYQSLHTAVVGPDERNMEVQIRTFDMHRHAELGVAAHWRYKEGRATDSRIEERVAWLRGFLEDRTGTDDYIERLKREAFHDRIYVLTPAGRVIDLPAGATPLDFAYAVHTEIGHRCRGAKADGAIVPLTSVLHSGQQVEILTAPQPGPSRDWLNPAQGYLRTHSARTKVRRWFREQDHDLHVAQGRSVLERERRRLGAADPNQEALAKRFGFRKTEELLAAIGNGDVSPAQLRGALRAEDSRDGRAPLSHPRPHGSGTGPHSVQVLGVDNLLTRVARCCKPLPGEPVRGYITQGQGIAIHRRSCRNLLRMAAARPNRLVEVDWDSDANGSYPVDLQLEASYREDLVRDVTDALAAERVGIRAVQPTHDRDGSRLHLALHLEVASAEQLNRVLKKLARVADVTQVRRSG